MKFPYPASAWDLHVQLRGVNQERWDSELHAWVLCQICPRCSWWVVTAAHSVTECVASQLEGQ